MPKCKYCGEKSQGVSRAEIAERLQAIVDRTRDAIGPEPEVYGHDLAMLELQKKWNVQAQLARARLALAGLLEMVNGAHLYCANFNPDPEVRRLDEPYACTGCGYEVDRCGPPLWDTQRKCCPDCSHTREQFECVNDGESLHQPARRLNYLAEKILPIRTEGKR
jgi:hypothetical protein